MAIRKYNPAKIIVISDTARSTKISIIAKVLFSELIKSKRLELDFLVVDRPYNHPNSNPDFQTNQALPELITNPKVEI